MYGVPDDDSVSNIMGSSIMSCRCEPSDKLKTQTISDSKTRKDVLAATFEQFTANIARLNREVRNLSKETSADMQNIMEDIDPDGSNGIDHNIDSSDRAHANIYNINPQHCAARGCLSNIHDVHFCPEHGIEYRRRTGAGIADFCTRNFGNTVLQWVWEHYIWYSSGELRCSWRKYHPHRCNSQAGERRDLQYHNSHWHNC